MDYETRERIFREENGEPHNLPDDHPDAWQWNYTGSKKEREEMLRRMGFELELEPDPDQEQPSQEETLW